MKKNLIRGGILAAAGLYLARQLLTAGKDVARYNAMSTMSGDPPLSLAQVREAVYPGRTSTTPTNAPAYGEDAKAPGFVQFLTSIPSDVARYLKMSSM